MNGNLKSGTLLTSESSTKYKVISLLGAGGQGEVYDVESEGNHFALKWYFKHMATREQKAILDDLIAKGSPDASFLWPKDIVFKSYEESFGYIMSLRPKKFMSIVDVMKRRAEPTFFSLCRAAFNLVNGYKKLHAMGYSYRDISFGNLFLNPNNGDVLICDNDNVSPNRFDNSSIYGTPRFMAPEIVTGKDKPSRNTDLYSLSVLLFYMLMLGHPLEGKHEYDIRCMDIHAMNKLFGTNPVFVYDPLDRTNRPVRGYQDNVIIYWDLYPQSIRDLFMHSFTEGLTSPNKRVTEKKWMDTFTNLMTGINICPQCGAEVFYDQSKADSYVAHTCWNCNSVVKMPASLIIGKNRILINKNAKLFSHHLYDDYDVDTVVGSVVQKPNSSNVWGIKNESKDNWTYIKSDKIQVTIPKGKSATIAKDTAINFGLVIGEFK